ncbi:MAG TPA: hypothetical protein VMU02_03350 [bacterium]|nr:hypothetical protein [bacterium]
MLFPLGKLRAFVLVCVVAILAAGVTDTLAQDLLSGLEPSSRHFDEFEVAGRVVYFHQRAIDSAAVEGDYINYQFDAGTKQLLAKKTHWRDDLPEHLPPISITRQVAEAMAAGEIQSSRLVIISPESAVLPLKPVPQDPCWVVRSRQGGELRITVIDALTGELLGYGVPPPYTAFSFTGPTDCPPTTDWQAWSRNAASWFTTMGYGTQSVIYPTLEQIRGHVKSDQTAMFFEIAHGDYSTFNYGCENGSWQGLPAFKISAWIGNYAKMPFTFLASCDGMCQLGSGSFSYGFRKGSLENTATVGYCGMSEIQCDECWGWSLSWQGAMFSYMNQGMTVRAAFDHANADYPPCGVNSCMRFAGDEAFKVVPAVMRDPEPPVVVVTSPNGGETIEYGTQYEILWSAADNARVTSVTILLSSDGGASFPDTIAAGEPNDSSYIWTVPDVSTHAARIRVVAYDGVPNQGSDVSDGDFTLWGTTAGLVEPEYAGVPDRAVVNVAGGNPVTSPCRLVYGVPAGAEVSLSLYDVNGRLVDHLASGYREAGYYRLDWSSDGRRGASLGTGIYFLRLDSDMGAATAKVVIAK